MSFRLGIRAGLRGFSGTVGAARPCGWALPGPRARKVGANDGMGRLRVTWTRGHDGPTASQYRKDMQPRLQKMYPNARITIRREPLPRVRKP